MRTRTKTAFSFLLWICFAAGLCMAAEEKQSGFRHESGIYYTVRQGDTLWDISERYSSYPWQWPEVWRGNDQITNPHRIYPGETIRLFHDHTVSDVFDRRIDSESVSAAPPSRPEPPSFYYPEIEKAGFVVKPSVQPCGVLTNVRGDAKKLIGPGDIVYLKALLPEGLRTGNRYTVYRTLAPTEDKKINAAVGMQHYILGLVEVTEANSQYATAKVVRAFRSIRIDDLLFPHEPRSARIVLTESPKGLEGKIIGAEEHQYIFGQNAVAFIDKGADDGVKPGQQYRVYYTEAVQKSGEGIKHIVDFAKFLVLDTRPGTATILITASENSIQAGAQFRSP